MFKEDYKIAENGKGFLVRQMSRFELNFAIESAATEGWNPGLNDADCFYAADPSGLFIGTLNRSPIGCISAVSYGDNFGFIGFYIIKPEFRNRGYGIQLWNAAIKNLVGVNSVGLDGVVEQQKNYIKSGFKLAHRNIRFEGKGNGEKHYSKKVIELTKVPFKTILKYDNNFFPADRNKFLRCWVSQANSKSIAFVSKKSIKGYGSIRKCRTGYKIGPLFADDKTIAEEIFISLIGLVEKNIPYYLDLPEGNSDALKLAENYKMKKVFETARMYKGKVPKLPLNKIYGITTFELG